MRFLTLVQDLLTLVRGVFVFEPRGRVIALPDPKPEHLPKFYTGTREVRRSSGSGWCPPFGAYFRRNASKRAIHRSRTGRA